MEAEEGENGGSPAPFLLKTYEMVDDASTDDIVSWSTSMKSFVVWDHPDLSARLLPTYFKHNNFSSFIRQLNTYGFRKIDPKRWEFANEDFVKGQKHLLNNIRRRKPIHSHGHRPGGGLTCAERTALEEEIDRLKRERASLQATLWRFEQHRSETKNQLDHVQQRVADMEKRQLKMIAFLQQAVKNPRFVETLASMATSSPMDFSEIHKKRRLPPAPDYCQENSESSLCDEHCSSSRLEFGQVLNQDFCDKLKLELCSAVLDSDLSNDDTGSSHRKLELCDTGESSYPTKNLFDDDGIFPCHLSLTLASSGMQMDRSEDSSRTPNTNGQHPAAGLADAKHAPVQETLTTSGEPPANPPDRVNDLFWEQFLTERPGFVGHQRGTL
ncbi:hypothetical protein Cni_G20140 [Canna indica]|uniref:HSF-type DNA-binding domain-containing protein n=1 Tax=Canna indica TaxID=4628 RepID=A0AAQ3KQS9_9LILI|nr:hypothetical protein Cni_G20140 [Canna indica]